MKIKYIQQSSPVRIEGTSIIFSTGEVKEVPDKIAEGLIKTGAFEQESESIKIEKPKKKFRGGN